MRRWTYRALVRALKDHDSRFFINKRGGKGSHRLLCQDGFQRTYPLPYHGDESLVSGRMVREIIQLFELPPELLE